MKQKKEKQSACKPGSVLPLVGEVPVIYLRRTSPHGSIVLPSGSDGPPFNIRRYTRTFNLRNARHGRHRPPGELLPHLLTLTSVSGSGCFLLHGLTLAGYFPLRSGVP